MPRVNNEPKPKKPKQVKRPTIKRNQKALITQDNRLIYSRYGDMTTNELKVFYWIISKLNPMTDQEFKKFEIPISELFTTLEHKDDTNHYTYIRKLCQSLGKRTFTDDTLSIDPITGKEINGFFVMPIFQILHYTDKQAVIYCELNKYIRPYLLGVKERFTSIPLDQILRLRSNYTIRIYQILLSEIKQNKKFLRLNLAYLQNTLEVPKSFYDWGLFNIKVLKQAQKEINTITNLTLFEIKTFKTGKKITEIEFHFDYKTHEESQSVEKTKQNLTNKKLSKNLNLLLGRTFNIKDYGEITLMRYDINSANFIEATFKNQENKKVIIPIKSLRDIKALEKQDLSGKNRAVILQFQREIKNNINRAKEISKNIAQRESGAKRESTQSVANNGATLFDKLEKLNLSSDTLRTFKRAIIPNTKQN